MNQTNHQKVKLLKLYEYLKYESDEEHPITTKEVIHFLQQQDITCDRRTLYKDIDDLNECGYEVMKTTVGKQKGYYVEDRSFSYPELKILVDAILAASFITEKKTQALITKIAGLGGAHRAKLLKGSQVAFKTNKRKNEEIYYVIQGLEAALRYNKQVSFQYFDLDENLQQVFRKNGQRYIVQPVALIFHEDNYYLITYHDEKQTTTTYRVDRMFKVKTEATKMSNSAKEIRNKLEGYTERVFKMFSGTAEKVTLDFSDNLIGVMYDKFGESIKIKRKKGNRCQAKVEIQVSPVFFGWLFQFGYQMKIKSPQSVIQQYTEHVQTTYESLKSQ